MVRAMGLGRGRPQNHCKYTICYACSWFFGGGVGGQESLKISRFLCISWLGRWGWSALEIYKFLCMLVVWAEGWAAPGAAESMTILRSQCIFIIRVLGLRRGRPQNHCKCIKLYAFVGARAAPESLQMHGTVCIIMVRACGMGAAGGLGYQGNLQKKKY